MFTNCVVKIFHKCQRAVRAPNPSSSALNYVDKKLPRFVNEWFRVSSIRIVNVIELEQITLITRKKLHKVPGFVREQWNKSLVVEVLKQHMLLCKIPAILKQHSANTVRLWAQQFECVVAQRIRRGQQIFSLYSKIWEERALREIVRHLSRRGRDVLMASCVAAIFDWERERISDDVMLRHLGDIEYVYKLQESTMTCSHCGLRLIIDSAFKHMQYCQCSKNTTSRERTAHLAEWEESIAGTKEEWQPFIERQDVMVWRQEHQDHNGLFAYKVYGRYDDVTAKDFLQVQLDTNYRKEWDSTAVELKILDAEPSTGSEVLYWEMAWPRLFANRDYVFKRRSLVDAERQRIVIRSESTQHPSCPPRSGLHRVTEYWSSMVIKPITDLDKPGIEFSLTYFDNPGLSIPSPVAAWVAISGLPDFLGRLRDAARVLRDKREEMQQNQDERPSRPPPSAPQTPQQESEPNQKQQTIMDNIQPSSSPTSRSPLFPKLCSVGH